MDSEAHPITGRVRIETARDRLRAWISLPGASSPRFSPPSESEVLAALTDNGIEKNEATLKRVRQYLQIIGDALEQGQDEGPPEIPERFLIAEGQAPVEAKDGSFEWDEAFDKDLRGWQGDAPVNYYTLNSILTIEANTRIGRILPPTEGQPGSDVFGQEVMPRRMKGAPLKLGSGLRTSDDDSQQVTTEVSGRLEVAGNAINMVEVLEIPCDVDFKSGNVDSVIDVHVRGSVKPNFKVKTTRSLTIDKAVDAAELRAGGDIRVRGGLFGQEAGRPIRAGGEITANICDGADVEAVGDVCIVKEILNSNIRTGGVLRIEHGSIIGGQVYGRNGVVVKHAGSEVGVPTRIAVGTDGRVLYTAQKLEKQIRKHQEQAEQIRARVEPLVANARRLSPGQREQATELMAKADEIEIVADDLRARRDRMLKESKPDKNAGILLGGTLYPGVVLIFGLRETTIRNPVKGPVRVEERKVKGATEIAIVNKLTGSVTPLPSRSVDLEPFRQAEQDAGGSDAAERSESQDGSPGTRRRRR